MNSSRLSDSARWHIIIINISQTARQTDSVRERGSEGGGEEEGAKASMLADKRENFPFGSLERLAII